MKKILLMLVTIMSIGLCSCDKDDLILIDATYENTQAIELTHTTLEDKLAYLDYDGDDVDGDNFILYVYTQGCSSCVYFETNVLNPYIAETGANIYKVNYTEIEGLIRSPSRYQTNPRIIIFDEGEIDAQTSIKQNEDVFKHKSDFNKYISKFCKISSLKEVNYTQLQSLLTDNTPKIIYYRWSSCGDCSYLDEHYLEYLLKQKCIENFYAFDVKDFRKYKNSTDPTEKEIYDNFLAEAKYEIDGNTGVVPTFIYLENNEVKSYAIYFNDEMTFSNSRVTVTKTAYGETNASICKTYEDYDDYQEETESYHNKKLYNFLRDTNLMK